MLLSLVLAFTSFSLVANAVELQLSPYHANVQVNYKNTLTGSTITGGSIIVYPNDGVISMKELTTKVTAWPSYSTIYAIHTATFATDDRTILFAGNKATTVRVQNFAVYFDYDYVNGSDVYDTISGVKGITITYIDGSLDYIPDSAISFDNKPPYSMSDITFDFTPAKDVMKIEVSVYTPVRNPGTGTFLVELGEQYDSSFTLVIDQDETKGLLQSIIDWVKSIRDGILNLPSLIFGKFSDALTAIKTTITELPSKIANAIKDLFVPRQEYLEDYYDIWENMLATKFGVLYQVGEYLNDGWDRVMESDATDTIYIDEVTIPLPDDCSFSFGGYSVQVVPEGFGVLVSLCKGFTTLSAVLLFINACRKRYDELMR